MSEYLHIILTLAQLYNVTEAEALAVARVESNYRMHVVGAHGEIGMFQIKPSTAQLSREDLLKPWINTAAALQYLESLKRTCKAPYQHFLCYNIGPTKGKHKSVQNSEYVKRVMFYKNIEKKGRCYAKSMF